MGNSLYLFFCTIGGDGKPKRELENMVQLATNVMVDRFILRVEMQELDLDKLQAQGLGTGWK